MSHYRDINRAIVSQYPETLYEWLGEALAAGCVIALPLVLLFIGAALGLS